MTTTVAIAIDMQRTSRPGNRPAATTKYGEGSAMNVRQLHRDLVARKLHPSRTPMFERAVFAVLSGDGHHVVGVDADGDDVFADSLLDAFDMHAADYDDATVTP